MSGRHKEQPIIIIHKHVDHDEEHGGAWKVAYADFVTAMMALFIVLWLLSSSEKVQKAVGGYFQDPTGTGRQVGSTNVGAGEIAKLNHDDMHQLKDKLEQAMKQTPTFEKMEKQVRITQGAEGLRIDLLETQRGVFFPTGSPKPTAEGMELIQMLASELQKLPHKVAIEGHSDSAPYGEGDYSNWELSSDRANAARRILTASGIPEDRISQVRGFAARRLLLKDRPTDPSNRRISIIVRNLGLDEMEERGNGNEPIPGPAKPGSPAKTDKAEGKAPAAAPHH
ncbi:flagellar motor protein MotB [uncultured Paludibaculum sp.]|uniref:flagellar motor protein MotB n=1 Tax=uncultured Paludibaculum sp. TaxID=1765020 RepID=UPI002AAC4BBF|nr:flagellar motor protein MotB [uncultured Paludibaculum sp.]